jgi:beta-hydroxylase
VVEDGFLDIERCSDILEPFQARWRELANEAEQLGAGWLKYFETDYAPFGWYLAPVRLFGIDNPDAVAAAPLLSELVARDGRVMTAQYLRLGPGAEVGPHYGRPMGVARFHLGLRVPEGCGLRVGDVTRTWVEGEWLAFDDSLVHSTWNHSDRDRVVLSLDFDHPDIPVPRSGYALRFVQGTFYDFVRRSPRARRSMMWYHRARRRRSGPTDASP